jgi:uracil-DNA glycosylase
VEVYVTTPYEDGDPQSPLCVLGQAPGQYEMKRGAPLVGPAGEVFRECLGLAGINRRNIYIVNVWETQVWTDQKTGAILGTRGGDELWNKKGFTAYGLELASPTLERLRNSGANCILALGQQALELCTGKSDKIMKWRGSPLEGLPRIGGKKLIPTAHPAATIHGVYLWRYLIISDMIKAKAESMTSTLELPRRDIIIRPTLAQALNFIRSCQSVERVATDLEVVNHQISCFSLCTRPDEGMTIPFTDESGAYWDEDDEVLIWQEYAKLMHDPKVMKINQNIVGFDAVFMMLQNHIRVRGEIGDPMIAMSLLYPEFLKGIDFQASMHTREPYWKDEGKMWKNEGGDFPQFWRYCGKDSCVAMELWDIHASELTRRGMWQTYRDTVALMDPLIYMTLAGLAVDHTRLEETKADIEQKILAAEAKLSEVADYPFNANSPSQVAKYFYEHKGLPPYIGASGGPTTDDKALSRILRKTNWPEAKLVQDIRNLKKLKGTYLDVQMDPDARIRCSWNPRGTWTGRLSSSQTILGTGMNLQNLDPRFKGFIVSDAT